MSIQKFYTENTRFFIHMPRWLAILIFAFLVSLLSSPTIYSIAGGFIAYSIIWYVILLFKKPRKSKE